MEIELKPCPFCGGEADVICHKFKAMDDSDTYEVRCRRCYSRTQPFYPSQEWAAKSWNRRVRDETD